MPNTAQFNKLLQGQTFEEVCKILGDPTTLLSSETAQMEPGIPLNALQSNMYEWRSNEANIIRILFKQNTLNDKVLLPAN